MKPAQLAAISLQIHLIQVTAAQATAVLTQVMAGIVITAVPMSLSQRVSTEMGKTVPHVQINLPIPHTQVMAAQATAVLIQATAATAITALLM